MNWKVIVGIFLVLGGLKASFAQINAYMSGSVKIFPVAAQLGSAALLLLGIFLIWKGRKKNLPPP